VVQKLRISTRRKTLVQELRGYFISVTASLPVDAEHGTWEMANPCHPF
jgi:hypothetical protein